jgi:cyclase
MSRKTLLNLWMSVGALWLVLPSYAGQAQVAEQEKPDVNALEVQQLKDNLYVVKGGGGNTTIFITSKGVVVVDTKNPGWGQPLLEKIKTIGDKPVIMIINTHSHADHTSGNVAFPPGVEIVAHENTKKNMLNMDFFKKPENARGLPTKTFKDKMSLFSGKDQIDLYWFGPTETGGDTWVVFPALRTMASGDAFPRLAVTILNMNNGGSPLTAPETLSKVVTGIKNVDTIITGHDDIRTWDDLRVFVEFREEFLNWAVAQLKAGKSVDEATAAWETPKKVKYQDYEPPDRRRIKAHLQGISDELNKQ